MPQSAGSKEQQRIDDYTRGYRHGKEDGANDLKNELRALLGIPSVDDLLAALDRHERNQHD